VQEGAFRAFLAESGLSAGTQNTRSSALKRVERAEQTDLDQEFDRDNLEGLIGRYSYSSEDQRTGRPNPSKIDIEPENLYKFLAFFRSALNSYRKFRGGFSEGDMSAAHDTVETEAVAESAGKTFALERDLQTALRSDISQLEPGLQIADGNQEAKVEAGFIDILAKDAEGSWVVIELKAELGRPAVVAQTLAYMASIAAERGGSVRGIIVASDFDRRVELAVQAVPSISLKRYRYRFEFS
jgi:hypothetical protein